MAASIQIFEFPIIKYMTLIKQYIKALAYWILDGKFRSRFLPGAVPPPLGLSELEQPASMPIPTTMLITVMSDNIFSFNVKLIILNSLSSQATTLHS